jgi:murein DD-endopeptidase MepM/ murein hydrolase activator NlpD
MYRNRILVLLIFGILAGCQPTPPKQTPFAVTIDTSPLAQVAQKVSTPVPTANPASSRTPTLPPTDTSTPTLTPTITPSLTDTLTPTITPSPTITDTPTITPSPTITNTPPPIASATRGGENDPNGTPLPTWTPPPPDPASQIADHFYFRRPIGDGGTNWPDRTYPYGGTSGGRLQVHHGVDIVNPTGTPILAAADGVVIYAGDDLSTVFGPQTNYYGNLVVIQHNFTSPEGLPVFTLYGHMNQVDVQVGQIVQQGLQIGKVGATGVALGPHVHFEVRVGDPFSFSATRNPELWMYPFRTFGTLAGRVTDANGSLLYQVTLKVQSADITRYAFSYADTSVNSDPTFGENFTLGDIPANYYEVTVSDNGRVRFQKLIYVYPNRTTWLDVQLN